MQIPLMRNIYQETKQVIIWLGEASAVEEGALKIFPNLFALMKKRASDGQFLDPNLPDRFESVGLPTPLHPVWRALGDIMSRNWFRRLWTLQEAVLPLTSVVLCGGQRMEWDTLNSFVTAAYACRLANWSTTGDVDIQTDFLNGYESVRMINVCRASIETELWGVLPDILLNVTRRRSVTNPADMVFGMLALMPRGDQQQITIDTSLPIERIYLEFARFYILNEPEECILNHTSSIHARPGDLPSWCPDFNSLESTVPIRSLFYDDHPLHFVELSICFRASFQESES